MTTLLKGTDAAIKSGASAALSEVAKFIGTQDLVDLLEEITVKATGAQTLLIVGKLKLVTAFNTGDVTKELTDLEDPLQNDNQKFKTTLTGFGLFVATFPSDISGLDLSIVNNSDDKKTKIEMIKLADGKHAFVKLNKDLKTPITYTMTGYLNGNKVFTQNFTYDNTVATSAAQPLEFKEVIMPTPIDPS